RCPLPAARCAGLRGWLSGFPRSLAHRVASVFLAPCRRSLPIHEKRRRVNGESRTARTENVRAKMENHANAEKAPGRPARGDGARDGDVDSVTQTPGRAARGFWGNCVLRR
ncbi:MAG: hypothetical protein MI923_20350, partial [Phycisphaerales bacterium]|nr:hypothetical protein [Phycisphaerales bacterium]